MFATIESSIGPEERKYWMLFGTLHADFAGFDHSRLEIMFCPKSLNVVEYVELPETWTLDDPGGAHRSIFMSIV